MAAASPGYSLEQKCLRPAQAPVPAAASRVQAAQEHGGTAGGPRAGQHCRACNDHRQTKIVQQKNIALLDLFPKYRPLTRTPHVSFSSDAADREVFHAGPGALPAGCGLGCGGAAARGKQGHV